LFINSFQVYRPNHANSALRLSAQCLAPLATSAGKYLSSEGFVLREMRW
jgi:hypothetical protein